MANYYADHYGVKAKKIIILYNDIDIEHFQKLVESSTKEKLRCEMGLPDNFKIILFVHWLSPRKGATYLTPLALNILKVIKNTMFLVVGDGPYQKQLEKESVDRGLQEYFRITGAVPNKKVFKYYRCSDLFILPSNEEGFPRVLLEAMASRTPFVAFDVGGVKDIIDDAQLDCVVPKEDIKAFSDQVVTVVNDPQLCKQLVKIGLDQVKKYDTKTVAKMFAERIVYTENDQP
jgi:glycosyltransferase involved in cell wall biosynthesis